MVVIAIIAILAATLLPALSKAKEKANTSKCRNNHKQILLSLRMYMDDFGAMAKSSRVGKTFDGAYTITTGTVATTNDHPGVHLTTAFAGDANYFCPLFDEVGFKGAERDWGQIIWKSGKAGCYPIGAVLNVTGNGEWAPLHTDETGAKAIDGGEYPYWEGQGAWNCGSGSGYVGVVRSCEPTSSGAGYGGGTKTASPFAGSTNWCENYVSRIQVPDEKVVTYCVANFCFTGEAPTYHQASKNQPKDSMGDGYNDFSGKMGGARLAHGTNTCVTGFVDGHVADATCAWLVDTGFDYPNVFCPENDGKSTKWANGNKDGKEGRPAGWALRK